MSNKDLAIAASTIWWGPWFPRSPLLHVVDPRTSGLPPGKAPPPESVDDRASKGEQHDEP